MINECHIKYVFDTLMGVIMVFVGDGVQDFCFPCFLFIFGMIFYANFCFGRIMFVHVELMTLIYLVFFQILCFDHYKCYLVLL